MKKLTGSEAKATLLAQELLVTGELPELLEDAIKAWLLEALDIAVAPAWVISDQPEIETRKDQA